MEESFEGVGEEEIAALCGLCVCKEGREWGDRVDVSAVRGYSSSVWV